MKINIPQEFQIISNDIHACLCMSQSAHLGDQWLFLPLIHPSLQRSLSKEEDIKRKYDGEIQKLHVEKVSLTDQLEHALQERNVAMQERNFVIQERNALALQLQQEYERAERQDSSNHCTICWFQMAIKF